MIKFKIGQAQCVRQIWNYEDSYSLNCTSWGQINLLILSTNFEVGKSFLWKSPNYIQSVLQTVGKQHERTHPSTCDWCANGVDVQITGIQFEVVQIGYL